MKQISLFLLSAVLGYPSGVRKAEQPWPGPCRCCSKQWPNNRSVVSVPASPKIQTFTNHHKSRTSVQDILCLLPVNQSSLLAEIHSLAAWGLTSKEHHYDYRTHWNPGLLSSPANNTSPNGLGSECNTWRCQASKRLPTQPDSSIEATVSEDAQSFDDRKMREMLHVVSNPPRHSP